MLKTSVLLLNVERHQNFTRAQVGPLFEPDTIGLSGTENTGKRGDTLTPGAS